MAEEMREDVMDQIQVCVEKTSCCVYDTINTILHIIDSRLSELSSSNLFYLAFFENFITHTDSNLFLRPCTQKTLTKDELNTQS